MKRKIQMPKKILSIFLCVLVVFSCVPMSVISVSAVDDLIVTIDTGAEVTLKDTDADSYYDIGTADELYAFAYVVNRGNTIINGELTADIVVNEGVMTAESTDARVWTPIGNFGYKGTFNGNNHTISGLYFNNAETDDVGLFGNIGLNGAVENTGVINSYFNGKYRVGGVVGYNYDSTITNCYNTGVVCGTGENVGGVVGYNYDGTITNCYNTGVVSGNQYVGGVVGFNYGTITNCYNTGVVSGTGESVGGVVGFNYGTITNSYNTGEVSGTSDVAGVAGGNSNGTITNCYNTGVVNGTGKNVGGMVGYNYNGTITNSYNTGNVSGNQYVGGVVGGNSNGTITNCYNIGEVSGTGIVGGVVGNNSDGTITNSYNTGEVSVTGYSTSGVVGYNVGTITNCYYLADSETDSLDGTTAKTADQFASGEVAYLLQGEQTENVWGQKISTDELPVLGGEKVYYGYITCGVTDDTIGYTNIVTTEEAKPDHNFENGFCTVCDTYWPATLNADGYYEIDNAGKLYWFADKVNNDYENFGSANAILTADIVVNEGKMTTETENARAWTPIGNYENQYTGTFNGNNHTVSGLYFNNTETMYVGLFGLIGENGAVENTDVINSYFNGYMYVGGVAGINIGTITNCDNTGDVSGIDAVGGVVGYNYYGGTITNCYNTGDVNGNDYVGGVVGYNYGTIINCYNTGEVSGSSDVGGVVGNNSDGTITNCYYLNTAYNGGINGADVKGSAEVKTVEQFKSGEVAYLLQGEQTENVWGQKINTDELPVLGGEKVYYGYITCDVTDDTIGYTNIVTTEEAKPDHNFENGFCTVCDAYEPTTLNADGYYEIGNAGQLYWFADKVNNDNANFGSANAILTADIVVNEGKMTAEIENARAWTPIGNYSKNYTGTFNGNNHTVSGLYFNNTETDYVGLFGLIGGNGAVENIGVINSYFNACWYVGGVAGYNYNGTITNCYNTGVVSGTDDNVGGVAGYNYNGTVTNCYNTGEVSGTDSVGGVVGNNSNGIITNSYNTGEVSGTGYSIGGVVGYNYKGTITNSYNTGTVSGTSYVGGVAGSNSNGTITNCYYLNTAYNGGINGADVKGSAEVKTVEQFKSGEVAYLLQGEQTENIWGQKLGTDELPVLGGKKVYYGYITCDEANDTIGYTNIVISEEVKPDHNFKNGFCTVCDTYWPATLNADGYYEIDNAGKLYWFADKVNNDYENFGSANAILTADIVVNEGKMTAETKNARAWTPIGKYGKNYIGTFNGNNHTVSGLYFNNSEIMDVGLFGCIGTNGAVKNIGVINSYFNGNLYVGGVAGFNNGTITNCYNIGEVSGIDSVGGVVGTSYGTITNCYNTDEVSGTGYSIGGVVGYIDGTITNCFYLSASETDSLDGTTAKTADQFASGEVAYLLQGEQPENIWGQKLGTDELPTLGGDRVYYGYITCDEANDTIGYTNIVTSEETKLDHNLKNGFCSVCKGYQPATLNADGYYEIGNAGQLYWFADKVNNDYENFGSANAVLTTDIVVNEGKMTAETDSTAVRHWTPIGNDGNPYTGTFNGNNHTVSGLYFNNTKTNYVGLFGFIGENGAVENIGVINSYFNGNNYVGGVLGRNHVGTTTNCYNTGDVSGYSFVGGVVGEINGTTTNCYNTGDVSGYSDVGGVVGENYGTITNCYNTGEVSGSEWYVGGVVGDNSGTITNCYNTGDVRGSVDVGGVVGYNYYGGTLTNCYNIGKVSGNEYVGGVVGVNYLGTLTNCYNTGEVSGSSDVGGVVAYNGGTLTNCYYLDTACTGGINGADVKGSAEAKTPDQFASGEVAYLLQAGVTADENGDIPEIWGQKLGTDSYPLLGSTKVYAVINCKGEVLSYNNTKGEILDHKFENGFCSVCKGYEPATLNADGYYEIGNAGQLYWFADKVNNDNANFGSANAILTADIVVNEGEMTAETDSSKVRHWIPIGTSDTQYNGIFNGNNHIVSGIYLNTDAIRCVGLIGYTGENGVVENIGISNSYMISNYWDSNLGGVVGENHGKTTNCYNISDFSAHDFIGRVGGVVGENYGTITNCYNTGHVNYVSVVGGVAGRNYGTITNCYNTGDINNENGHAGGVVAENHGAITNCNNSGNIKGCVSAGGIVGYSSGTIINCYNTGSISSIGISSQSYIGGIVGADNSGTITNCYNTGSVSSGEDLYESYIGGVVAQNRGSTITNCYNTGKVSGYDYVGVVSGFNYDGTITNCYYLSDSETDELDGTTAKTAEAFASGEVAYLLQAGVTADENGDIPEIWGQDITTGENDTAVDVTPTLGGNKVYYGYKDCHATKMTYGNNKAYDEIPTHNFENGKCTICGDKDPSVKTVAVTGDIALALEETDDNIFTGVIELQAGTYSFNLDDNGTTLGFKVIFTDAKTIDYTGGFKAPSTLNATGGKYTFTYNTSTKKLVIAYKPVQLLGDVNGNGNIDLSDVIFVLKHVVGNINLDDNQSFRADVNSNGEVSVLDAILIQKMILEMA